MSRLKDKAYNTQVTLRDNEDGLRLIRRFMKKVKKERIVEDFLSHTYYKKPSDKKREEKKERARILRNLKTKHNADMNK